MDTFMYIRALQIYRWTVHADKRSAYIHTWRLPLNKRPHEQGEKKEQMLKPSCVHIGVALDRVRQHRRFILQHSATLKVTTDAWAWHPDRSAPSLQKLRWFSHSGQFTRSGGGGCHFGGRVARLATSKGLLHLSPECWRMNAHRHGAPSATRSEHFTPFQPSIDFSVYIAGEIDLFENLDIVHITLLVAGPRSPAPTIYPPALGYAQGDNRRLGLEP